MKSLILTIAATSSMLLAASAHADQALATAKGCMGCHDMGAKKVGPAYKDVAKKYAGQKNAEATLVKSVLEGSSGKWGSVIPMSPNKTMGVTEADAKKLVTWILSQK